RAVVAALEGDAAEPPPHARRGLVVERAPRAARLEGLIAGLGQGFEDAERVGIAPDGRERLRELLEDGELELLPLGDAARARPLGAQDGERALEVDGRFLAPARALGAVGGGERVLERLALLAR